MFESTRLKLTLWYLIAIMAVSFLFSFLIYRVQINELERLEHMRQVRFERTLQGGGPRIVITDPELLEEAKQRILIFLFAVNGIVFLAAGGLGYVVAGRTLQPISDMVEEQHRFISDASHELKTPLTSLKSAFEVYLRDKKRSVGEADAVVIESIEEVNKLQSLAESLLELAQFQQLSNYGVFEEVALDQVLKKAFTKVAPMAKKKYISLVDKIKPASLEADAGSLLDLFVIVLDNAIKYSPRNSKIIVGAAKNDGFIIITIKDEGVGIAQKDIPHIFDRFYRADSARTSSGQAGYGLGLSIAQKIVDAHHGEITVVSAPEKGSTFTVRLPVRHSGIKKSLWIITPLVKK